MPELPVWLQEIRDRAEAATKGPWVSATGDGPFGTQSNVRTTEGWPEVIASRTIVGAAKPVEQQESNFAFIAHARMDVPRLVELVAEMAGALDSVVCVFDAMNDVELPLHVGMETARAHRAAQKVLTKYRGEVENA